MESASIVTFPLRDPGVHVHDALRQPGGGRRTGLVHAGGHLRLPGHPLPLPLLPVHGPAAQDLPHQLEPGGEKSFVQTCLVLPT